MLEIKGQEYRGSIVSNAFVVNEKLSPMSNSTPLSAETSVGLIISYETQSILPSSCSFLRLLVRFCFSVLLPNLLFWGFVNYFWFQIIMLSNTEPLTPNIKVWMTGSQYRWLAKSPWTLNIVTGTRNHFSRIICPHTHPLGGSNSMLILAGPVHTD